MRKVIAKVIAMSIVVSSFVSANDNIVRSLSGNSVSKVQNYRDSKDLLQDIQRQALTSVGSELGVDTAIFNKNNDFSVYLKVASTSRVGFKYKF